MTLASDIATALSHGLEYMLAAQDASGAWTDWELPPGPSPDWTTAHVGLRLAGLGEPYYVQLAEALRRAARWLLSRQAPGGGWGYNQAVEPDSDSTAQAVLLFAGTGHLPPQEACAFLVRHQRQDGGFATFLPDALNGSWGISHAEITPVALLALRAFPNALPEHGLARGVEWLRHARRPDGLWNSFWWTTPLVATEWSLSFLDAVGTPVPRSAALEQWAATDSLETALLLSIAAAAGTSRRLERLAQRLLADQASDGSWKSAPALRITARDCERPWEAANTGRLFVDQRRLHGTATVLAALSKARCALARA
jgi:hypothetical protein